VYFVEGDARKAIETFQRAKELEPPGRPEILLALGNAYLAEEHYPEAVREYQVLLENAPENEEARVQLAKALRAEGHREFANQVSLRTEEHPDTAKPR
jgi:tetratricopeptide (TPR) repeat protein